MAEILDIAVTIRPNATVKLLTGVNISADYRNTLYFTSKSNQYTELNKKTKYTLDNFAFIKNNVNGGRLKINYHYSEVLDVNYLMFNTAQDPNKWFYAFVTSVEYANEFMTFINYEIDILQSWLFDINFKPSYIERETVKVDTENCNEFLEELGTGQMLPVISTESNLDFEEEKYHPQVNYGYMVVIQSTINLEKLSTNWNVESVNDLNINVVYEREGHILDGVGTYCLYYSESLSGFIKLVNALRRLGAISNVLATWVYPTCLLEYTMLETHGVEELTDRVYTVMGVVTTSKTFDLPIRPTTCQGATVRNKRLLGYPFTQLIITNNNGSAISLRYEDFYDPETPLCKIFGTSTAEAKVRLVPSNYLGASEGALYNVDSAIDSAPMPSVSWDNDAYAVYLAQNRNTILNNFDKMQINAYTGAIGTAVSSAPRLMAGDVVGVTGSMVNSVLNTKFEVESMLATMEDAKARPDTASGLQSQGLAIQNGKGLFSAYVVQPDLERVKQLDDYFTVYGYGVKRIKEVSLKNRTRWTYIKTADLNITGSVPHSVINTFKTIFNNGVTFWVNNSDVGNYSLDNGSII